MTEKEILERLSQAIIDGNEEAAKKAAEEAVKAKINISVVFKEGIEKGMAVISEKFRNHEIFLPSVMLAADAMKSAIDILNPSKEELDKRKVGTVVIGTTYGDIHDIGKTIVAVMLTLAGFEVHDLGVDVTPKTFVDKADEVKADIIATSSLMSPSMHYTRDVIELLKARGIREKYKVIFGGGAVFQEYAMKIGGDGYGYLAEDGVKLCKEWMLQR